MGAGADAAGRSVQAAGGAFARQSTRLASLLLARLSVSAHAWPASLAGPPLRTIYELLCLSLNVLLLYSQLRRPQCE
jgi:hypothetical protein